MSNELTVFEQNSLAVMPVINLQVAKERRNQMVAFVNEIMIKDSDYGTIPGTGGKPTLLKPGAEKLTTFFGLSKRFEIIEREEDWTGQAHGEPFFYYFYKCLLYRGDQLIAEGDGSCSSFESKYRYRKAERVCPNCGAANIRKSKQGGGWYCWQKTGGCGATFQGNDEAITSQEVGRIANPDVCDQVNTIQKMAQKRALIAATLLAVNASEFFTQDLEDYVIEGDYVEQSPQSEPSPPPQQQPAKANSKPNGNGQADKAKPYKWPSTAAKNFYEVVQTATNDGYTSPYHLVQTIGGWFNFADEDLYNEKMSIAVDHIRMKVGDTGPGLFGDEPQPQGAGAFDVKG